MPNEDPRSLPHIYLPGHGAAESYTYPGRGGDGAPPMRDRARHAAALEGDLARALANADALRATPDPDARAGQAGFYLEFELPQDRLAVVDKLEKRGRGERIELVAVRPRPEENRVAATVFVPESLRDHYRKKIEAYRTLETPTGKPKNEPLVASIDGIRLAALRSLYTDDPDLFPEPGQAVWWEVWLRGEKRASFGQLAERLQIVLRRRPHGSRDPGRPAGSACRDRPRADGPFRRMDAGHENAP